MVTIIIIIIIKLSEEPGQVQLLEICEGGGEFIVKPGL